MISHILSLYKIKFQIDYILVCNVGIFRGTKKLKLTGFLKTWLDVSKFISIHKLPHVWRVSRQLKIPYEDLEQPA